MLDISSIIKEHRMVLGISQKDFASLVGRTAEMNETDFKYEGIVEL